MRVIAGRARSLPLKTPAGMDTRPTTDRIKETLFNMLQSGLYGCHFLDLYSGSGAIGIEALSRGAEKVVFVEQQSKALACIRENLAFTHLDGIVMGMAVEAALPRLEETKEVFDYIFMDPPYGKEEERRVLEYLSHSSLVDEDTVIIVEADLMTDFSYLEELGFYMKKQKRYKTNQHVFIMKE
ncbi:MAG: 16S rRNA (guanine(966)-N(2))-methyltransferase RsmD [Clostridiales bacterium]|nr:16S rRNA (guanine(966)-N(2))-methyltransferase RsmD [Clostridiales bacterium]